MVEGSFDGERLKFEVSVNELWKQWCEMQTPIADEVSPGGYACAPNWSGGVSDGKCFLDDPKTGAKVYFECGKLALCQHTCQCTAQSCSIDLPGTVSFDMILAPPKADGSVAGLGNGVLNVHLKKQ